MIRSYCLALCSLWCGFAYAGAGLSDAESLHLLQKVASAAKAMPYQGVYVQQRAGVIETYRLHHAVLAGVEMERRQALDGSAREFMRRGESVSLYLPPNVKPSITRNLAELSYPQLPRGGAEVIVPNYQIRAAGQARVAGLDADIYTLEPKDKLRYPKKIWVDSHTGLLLKVALQNSKRELQEVFAFSQIDLSAPPKAVFAQLADRDPVSTVKLRNQFPVAVAEAGWDISEVPAGFRLIQQGHRSVMGQSQPVIHHVYGDGLCSISIFLEPEHADMPQGLVHQGMTHILGREVDGFHVTVIGDAPLETIEKFSKAYRPRSRSEK